MLQKFYLGAATPKPSCMFLKSITIKNFKCHKYLWLDFTCNDPKRPIRKTTFMLGENGTGKSALLKAIALITAGSSGISDVLGLPADWIRNGQKLCEISAVITTAKNEEREISFKIKRGHDLRQIISENYNALEQIDKAILKAERSYFVVAYGASRRLNRGNESFHLSKRFSSPRSVNIQTLFNPDASLVSLTNWAMELDYQKSSAGLNIIKKALNQFLLSTVKFKRIDKKQKTLIFSTPDGEVPLEQLSDGYQNVSAWVGDLMYNVTNTFSDYKDPLKVRGLLLIDEIDLHLHPTWQRLLHLFLKEKLPNMQVVASTHSPLTAQQAEEGELYALRRQKNNIELIPFIGDPSKMLLHQLLASPVFGVFSDESLKIETAKNTVRSIRLKTNISASDDKKLKEYGEILRDQPVNIRANSVTDPRDLALLEQINLDLKEKQ